MSTLAAGLLRFRSRLPWDSRLQLRLARPQCRALPTRWALPGCRQQGLARIPSSFPGKRGWPCGGRARRAPTCHAVARPTIARPTASQVREQGDDGGKVCRCNSWVGLMPRGRICARSPNLLARAHCAWGRAAVASQQRRGDHMGRGQTASTPRGPGDPGRGQGARGLGRLEALGWAAVGPRWPAGRWGAVPVRGVACRWQTSPRHDPTKPGPASAT